MIKKIGYILILLSLLTLSMSLVSANENNTINTLDDTTHQDNINNQVMENNNNKLAPNEQTTPHENAEKYPKTIHVQGNTFKDIQNAINSASENDTIILNGTYTGNGTQIIVNKSLTITSNNQNSIIDAKELSRCLYIQANNVTLKNIDITRGFKNNVINFNLDDLSNFYYENAEGGAGIHWAGNNGVLINCKVYDNCVAFVGCEGYAVYWKGSNGSIINSSFYSNSYYDGLSGVVTIYPIVSGSIHGYYEGDIWSVCYFRNVSLNAKANLTFNKIVTYDNCMAFRVVDEHNLPYINETIKIHIYNKNYDNTFEVKTNSNGSAKLEIPLTLTTGKYNIEFNVKIFHTMTSVGLLPSLDWTTHYLDVLIDNSSLSVVKSNVYLKSNNLITYYNSGKYITAKLVDSKNKPIKNAKIRYNIYYKNKLIKTYYKNTNNKGICNLPINLNTGNYKVIISQINPNYNTKTITKIIKITKAPTIIKTQNIIKKNKLMKIQIQNKNKKPINNIQLTIKIFTGKTYKTIHTKTNNKGITTIKTKNLKTGNHKIQITTKNPNYTINKITTLKITP